MARTIFGGLVLLIARMRRLRSAPEMMELRIEDLMTMLRPIPKRARSSCMDTGTADVFEIKKVVHFLHPAPGTTLHFDLYETEEKARYVAGYIDL
jgi:hypothetical protein